MKNIFFETDLKSNLFTLLIIAILSTLFLPLVINSVFIVALFIWTIVNLNKINFKGSALPDYILLLFFIWFGLSFFWSIDREETLNAIIKQASFFVIPLAFIVFKKKSIEIILKWFSHVVVAVAVFFIIRALARFFILNDANVFFFHGDYKTDLGLVPKELNAIYVGAYACLSFTYFFIKKIKSKVDFAIIGILLIFILMLQANAVLFATALIIIIYFSFYSKSANKLRLRNLLLILCVALSLLFYKKVNHFFANEFKTNTDKGIGHDVIAKFPSSKHRITIYEAWNNKKFTPNDFFPGTAFRVYQARLFFEFLQEENIFWTGFGLNASYNKLEEKGIYYNVFLGSDEIEGYQKKNFHNQYIQVFAELGIVGFLLLVLLLGINLKNALKNKDFLHIAFAILMISLFLTESFLWRQRGVVFFALFYCLFNVNYHIKSVK